MTVDRPRDSNEAAPPLDRIHEFVVWARESLGGGSLKARQEAEDQARELLDRAAGSFERSEALAFGRLLSTDARAGELRYDRFSPAFHGAVWARVLENLEVLNHFLERLWKAGDEEAERAAAELLDDPGLLPGAGRALPSVLLYLRSPERYAVWLAATGEGLRALAGTPRIPRAQGMEGYARFCAAVQELAQAHELAPPEVDGVLALAARVRRLRARGDRDEPTAVLGSEAFAFLADLAQHSRADWMAENRQRYRAELAEPFRALLRAVARHHIDDLDPELNTDIKTGQVLASIRRRFPDGEREYYDDYWGAFSRQRKQEDAQLYVRVAADRLEAGLAFGEVSDDALARVRARAKERAAELWAGIAPLAPELVFASSSRDDAPVIPVTGSVGLVECLEGERPRIFKCWGPEDPPVGTPELVPAVGRVLETLYPIAALAWMEEQRMPRTREGPEPELELDEYDLEELARDTLLPIEELEEWVGLLRGPKRQALFSGPPGTGKTHLLRAMARHLAAPHGRVELFPLHPAYSYEDFVERPGSVEGGRATGVRSGVFLDFCEAARRQPDATFVAVLDEVGRVDLAALLGELVTLLEQRGQRVVLPYSRRAFGIPRNVVVLAALCSADVGLGRLDFALRRRFHTVELAPSREVLARFLPQDEDGELALALFDLVLERVGDPRVAPGQGYFMQGEAGVEGLYRVWRYELLPYLAALWSEEPERLQDLERSVSRLLGEGA